MNKSQLRVSLVIPAYNEESHLRACLRAAQMQVVPFAEIIVVDNNSTDDTVKIARSFKGVKVLHERQQGKAHARNAGFNAVRADSDVIARIDADTLVPPDWNAMLARIFADKTVAGVSGRPAYYDVALPRVCNTVENWCRRRLAHELRDMLFLQGANMAIRRTAWQQVQNDLCDTRTIHEDFDVAIHMQERGLRVAYDERLVAGISARCVDVSFPYFLSYVHLSPYSYAYHHVPHYRRMYPVVAMIIMLFLPARVLYRGRDPRTGKFSLARVLTRKTPAPRADPAAVASYLS